MFGKSKDMEIAEIKTGTLNVHYVDFITEKRKKTNKTTGNDKFEVFFPDASEEEFKRLVDEFTTENEKFRWGDFLNYLAKMIFIVIMFLNITVKDLRVNIMNKTRQ